MPTEEIFVPKSWVTADVKYYTEQWIDENDFTFLDDTLYEILQEDFSAFVVSPTVKARYKFPAHDPSPNLIVDNRTLAQIVSDILRIWCQFLTKSEQDVWNDIAQRDLTKTLSLPPGLRIPKSFIDKAIKYFRNLQASEKQVLLKKLISAPNTPYLTKSEPSVPPVSLSPSLDSSNQIPQISCSPENQTTAFLNVSPSVPQSPTDVLVPSIVPPQTTACLTVPQSRLTETTGLDQPGRINDLLEHCHARVT